MGTRPCLGRNGPALVWLAGNESGALLKLAQFQRAADVGSRGLDDARQAGLQSWDLASIPAAHAADALLALGRTAAAAALIGPLTNMPPDGDRWLAHVIRAEIDLLRGDAGAAAERWQQIYAIPALIRRVDFAYEAAPRALEASLWARRPGDALRESRRALALFEVPDLTILSGRLLTASMRACADLAEQARARGQPAADAVDAAGDLAAWVEQMGGVPFADHPTVAAIPAERATWDAERTRVAGPSDPDAWARRRESLAGPGLPAPGRICLVAAGRGAARCRAAGRCGYRGAASRRGGRRRARTPAGADPRAGRARQNRGACSGCGQPQRPAVG